MAGDSWRLRLQRRLLHCHERAPPPAVQQRVRTVSAAAAIAAASVGCLSSLCQSGAGYAWLQTRWQSPAPPPVRIGPHQTRPAALRPVWRRAEQPEVPQEPEKESPKGRFPGPLQWLRRYGKRLLPMTLFLGLAALFLLHRRRGRKMVREVALSSLLDFIEQHSGSAPAIKRAILGASQCVLVLDDGRSVFARWPALSRPAADELWSALRHAHIPIVAEASGGVSHLLVSTLLMVVYLGVILTFLRRMTSGGGGGKTWGDARKKVLQAQQVEGSKATVTSFKDIAGIDEAKEQVQEVVDILKSPGRYAALGARVPYGVLLVGPPGSGKTLLARACAAEAGVPFLNAAATEFVELFVGRGAARVRQLFERASKLAPCIVFIDEVDALRARQGDFLRFGGNQEAEQTLNQLLTCMDGLTSRGNGGKPVVVLGATNRPEVLDEALLRPGRFDRVVQVGLPNAAGRARILDVHLNLKQVPRAYDLDFEAVSKVAVKCEGMGGAALEALVNEAAIRAARRNSSTVSVIDLDSALSDFNGSRESTKPGGGFPWKL